MRVVVGLLAAGVAIDTVAVLSDLWEYSLVSDIIAGSSVTRAELLANDQRQAIIGLIQAGVLLSSAVAFIVWFHRAYSNLPALGADGLRYGKGWAIGAWFIPIFGWIRPKAMANDIWRATSPDLPPDRNTAWLLGSVPLLVDAWWALWVVSSVLGNLLTRTRVTAETIEEFRSASLTTLAADVATLVTGILAIMVVRALTQREEQRAQRVAGAGIDTAPQPDAVAERPPSA